MEEIKIKNKGILLGYPESDFLITSTITISALVQANVLFPGFLWQPPRGLLSHSKLLEM